MKILITGATGLVGTAIMDLCRSRNIEVNFLTTNKEKINAQGDYQGYYWNPDTSEIDISCFEGVSSIINLAGSSISKRWSRATKADIFRSRINSLKTLYKGLKFVGKGTIKSLVSVSGIGKYPNSLSAFYTEKEKQTDPSFLGEVVTAWEKEADEFKALNIKVSKIRVGLVLSSEGGALPEIARPIRNYVGAAFGSGAQWQSWIHIQDLARIFLFIVENELQGIYNAVAPNPVTNAKMVKEIAEVLDKPLILPNIPEFIIKSLMGEMAYLLFVSQRVSSKKIEAAGFGFNFKNINGALLNIYQKDEKHSNEDSMFTERYS